MTIKRRLPTHIQVALIVDIGIPDDWQYVETERGPYLQKGGSMVLFDQDQIASELAEALITQTGADDTYPWVVTDAYSLRRPQ